MRCALLLLYFVGLSACGSREPSPEAAQPPPLKTPPLDAQARPSPAVHELVFAKGASSAVLEEVLPEGERHWVEFVANAEQTLEVSMQADPAAVFGLYVVSPYGWNDRTDPAGNVAFKDIETAPEGPVVPGDQARTTWSGPLPYGSKSGQNSVYALEVSGTEGTTRYRLNVSITD